MVGDWIFAGQGVTWEGRDRHTIPKTGLTWGVLLEEGKGEREERKYRVTLWEEREKERERESSTEGYREKDEEEGKVGVGRILPLKGTGYCLGDTLLGIQGAGTVCVWMLTFLPFIY